MIPASETCETSAAALRILIVDDLRDNTELLRVILEWEGFVVRTAASGEEALEDLAEAPADLVLLDVMMPGMDGYEVVARIKKNPATKGVHVLMLSALTGSAASARAVGAGADGVLAKPIDRGELMARVRSILGPSAALPRAAS